MHSGNKKTSVVVAHRLSTIKVCLAYDCTVSLVKHDVALGCGHHLCDELWPDYRARHARRAVAAAGCVLRAGQSAAGDGCGGEVAFV